MHQCGVFLSQRLCRIEYDRRRLFATQKNKTAAATQTSFEFETDEMCIYRTIWFVWIYNSVILTRHCVHFEWVSMWVCNTPTQPSVYCIEWDVHIVLSCLNGANRAAHDTPSPVVELTDSIALVRFPSYNSLQFFSCFALFRLCQLWHHAQFFAMSHPTADTLYISISVRSTLAHSVKRQSEREREKKKNKQNTMAWDVGGHIASIVLL